MLEGTLAFAKARREQALSLVMLRGITIALTRSMAIGLQPRNILSSNINPALGEPETRPETRLQHRFSFPRFLPADT